MDYVWNNESETYTFETPFCPPVTQWSFVAVSIAEGQAVIYMDSGSGLQAETNVWDQGYMGAYGGAGPMQLGGDVAYTGTGNRNYGGLMAQVAYFNRALAPGEVAALDNEFQNTVVAPTITVGPVSQTGFAGMPIILSVDAFGQEPLTYQWQLNGTNILGATGGLTPSPILTTPPPALIA